MLAAVGAPSLEELIRVPDAVALKAPLDVPAALPEADLARKIAAYAARNTAATEYASFLGAGAYRHYCPPVVMALAMRGEFLTAYTPYQAEVSQGYLQAIYEWQTYICLLTGLDIANASVYDGATALAEGAIMAVNATGRRALLVSSAVHPNYRDVLRTYARGLDLAVDELPTTPQGTTDFTTLEGRLAEERYAAVALQSPNFFGCIDTPPTNARAAFESTGTVPIGVVAEALSLAALLPPAEWGAQIAVGEAQSFGNPLNFGGPYVGFVACATEHVRRIPGRLVGRSLDNRGKPAYVLTLQAREQHIRREKATSNICTNQALIALMATVFMSVYGKEGLRELALQNLSKAHYLAGKLKPRFSGPFFNEFVAQADGQNVAAINPALEGHKIIGGLPLEKYYPELKNTMLLCCTEMSQRAHMDQVADAFTAVSGAARR